MVDDAESWDGGSPWLFMIGLVLFLGSGLLFVADLIRGIDILRSIGANAVGAALLILWAAHDTLRDPKSEVASTGGAAGTALLLYGLYLLLSGAIIVLSGLVHARVQLGFWYLGFAILAFLIGLRIFPTEAITDNEQPPAETADETDTEGADATAPQDDSTDDASPVSGEKQ